MKLSVSKVLLVAMLGILPSARAGMIITLTGHLDASQVVDVVSTSNATGFATLIIDTNALTLTLDFTWQGLTGTADRAHLHDAPANHSRQEPPNNRFFDEVISEESRTVIPCGWSDPMAPVYDNCAPATGSLHYVEDISWIQAYFGCDPLLDVCDIQQFEQLALNDGFYLDIHTEKFMPGEIRGQLLVDTPEPSTVWLLPPGLGMMVFLRRRLPKSRD
ncbi:MAG: CHRD domain-containing protein [Bryobacteraceae bacterium]